ncbi:hypothetical protein LHJ74_14625 [Streptomyces sp. N2-109]|uniref:Integral membrane protein n=1 Tax=Streptomyces gossypii TaxID=2883101 RepID=A0ABT2JTE3_9ACTN|nr:hypothetical protein [Streptomyces gossypii]MCT2591128.1 hypothetical protein [Streptomyces gossypii]
MLEIGLHGLSLLLTVLVVAAVKKGGQTIGPAAGLAAGVAMAYAYARTGRPWSILAEKAQEMTATGGAEFGVVPAAVALSLYAWWWYTRPKLLGSVVLGFLLMTAASASSGLWKEITSVVGSFITIFAG